MQMQIIEQAIIAHLSRVIAGVKVQSFPPKPQDYVLQTANAAVLVRFVDERTKEDVLGKSGQHEVFFDISIVARNFDSQTGVYVFYDAIKTALNWVQFGEDSGKAAGLIAKFRGGRYDNYDPNKGLWYYVLRFSFDVPYVPVVTPAQKVTQITIADITTHPDNTDNPNILIIPEPL